MKKLTEHSLRHRARHLAGEGRYAESFMMLSSVITERLENTIDMFALAYEIAQTMPGKSRYAQYQNRYFDFGIEPGDKVLDMGSGHIPFPLATHLADISLTDHTVGRAGVPFKHVDGKPVYECSVENTPFADKEFDFVYCSHVLEHVSSPEAACRELIRIGKRGYIECPSRGKDTFFATARLSNHLWGVESLNGVLVFTEYADKEKDGVGCDILLDMNCSPRTRRERAVAALDILMAHQLNTMLMWEDSFSFEVRRQCEWPSNVRGPEISLVDIPSPDSLSEQKKPCFMRKIGKKIHRLRSKAARFLDPESS